MGATPVGGSASWIDQGVEYDKMTGRVIAYHFTDPDGWGRVTKVLAKDVVHGFETRRPGQLRGISPWTPGVILAGDLNSYIGATVDTAKLAAKWLALVDTPDPLSRQLGGTVVPPGLQGLTRRDNPPGPSPLRGQHDRRSGDHRLLVLPHLLGVHDADVILPGDV